MRRKCGRSLEASLHGDVDDARRWLSYYRREGNRGSVIFWRQVLTVSAAAQRARARDLTAARRLAWRHLIFKVRRHATWLVERYRAHEAHLTRLLREDSTPGCVACHRRQDAARRNRDEYLTEIAALPGQAPSYAEYRRRPDAAERWFTPALAAEPTITPEETLLAAGIDSPRQAEYQRRMSTLLGGRA